MSQFKNLYDATNNLNASPTGAQQQTDYNNTLSIYNNYLSSIVGSVKSTIVNNTTMSNAVETKALTKGNLTTSLLNTFIFNPAANLGYVNVNSIATIKSLSTTNILSTYIKNQRIQQKLFYSYLPNGSPGRLIIDYTLDPTLSTSYTATGQNYFFEPFDSGISYSMYYTMLIINNLPTTPNRIYTFNFYALSRYNSHNTIFNPATISVNSVDIPLNGISNITFPATNTYVTQNISIISSPTLPISYLAYTTVQCVNITNLLYVAFTGYNPLNFISTTAYNSCQGAYGCRLLNTNYTGPILTLKASGGTGSSSNFYSDVSGNLTTGVNGTGVTLASWLTTQGGLTTYAYVSTWYDQSVTCSNNATQITTTSQPIYDVVNKLINFGYTGANGGVAAPNIYGFFNLPDGALPYNDTSYTYCLKHWNIEGPNLSSFFWGGNQTISKSGIAIGYALNKYFFTWYGDDLDVPSASNATSKNVVSSKYSTGGSRYVYVNGSSSSYALSSARTQPNTSNFIGKNTVGTSYCIKCQMYYFYVFGSSLLDADRVTLEATVIT